MKKFISVILLFSICISAFTSCSNKDADGIAVQDFCSRYSSNYGGDYQWSYKDVDYNKLYDIDFEDADVDNYGYYEFCLQMSLLGATATMEIGTLGKHDNIRRITIFLDGSVSTTMFFSQDDFVKYFSSILFSVNPELDKNLVFDRISAMLVNAATSQINEIVLDHIDDMIFHILINYNSDITFVVSIWVTLQKNRRKIGGFLLF